METSKLHPFWYLTFVPKFKAGFETGDLSEFDGYVDGYPDTKIPTVVTAPAPVHHGVYSCKFEKIMPHDSQLYKNLSGYTELYYQGAFRFQQLTSYDPFMLVLLTLGSWGDEQHGMGIRRDSALFGDTDPRFFGYYLDHLGFFHYYNSSKLAQLNTWYVCQLGGKQHATEGFLKVWVDKTQLIEVLNVDSYDWDFSSHDVGLMILQGHGTETNILHGDCVVLNDDYIPLDPFS